VLLDWSAAPSVLEAAFLESFLLAAFLPPGVLSPVCAVDEASTGPAMGSSLVDPAFGALPASDWLDLPSVTTPAELCGAGPELAAFSVVVACVEVSEAVCLTISGLLPFVFVGWAGKTAVGGWGAAPVALSVGSSLALSVLSLMFVGREGTSAVGGLASAAVELSTISCFTIGALAFFAVGGRGAAAVGCWGAAGVAPSMISCLTTGALLFVAFGWEGAAAVGG